MIVVTGGAGFIGSALVWALNERGYHEIVVVDRLRDGKKWLNLSKLEIHDYFDKKDFIEQVQAGELEYEPDVIFHLGACSSTTEEDADYLMRNNFQYTRKLAEYALAQESRFIYASSAATYGGGELGYLDDHNMLSELQPLNKYAYSKHLFDLHALHNGWLEEIVGLKYFNVYGPHEFHKGEMRSVIHKSTGQALENDTIRLFKSHREDYEDGQQKRDFLYVKDAVKMTLFFMDNPEVNGIYNIGAGTARTFDDLAGAVFETLEKPEQIEYFDMPEEIRERYQYYTEADLTKLREAGYTEEITSLEAGIEDYLENHLLKEDPYLG